MFHLPRVVIPDHSLVKVFFANKIFQLIEEHGTHGISHGAVRPVCIKVVGSLAGGLLKSARNQRKITGVTARMRVLLIRIGRHGFTTRKVSETFVHPRVERFI